MQKLQLKKNVLSVESGKDEKRHGFSHTPDWLKITKHSDQKAKSNTISS